MRIRAHSCRQTWPSAWDEGVRSHVVLADRLSRLCRSLHGFAEGVGFEPTRTGYRPSGFQDRRHRPLGEPSIFGFTRRTVLRMFLVPRMCHRLLIFGRLSWVVA